MTIGIICAMYQEYLAVRDIIVSAIEQKDDLYTYTCGYIAKVQVLLVHSGVGKVCAALATQEIIREYKVDMILIIGFSGSLSNSINVGDVFLTNQVVDNSSYVENGIFSEMQRKSTMNICSLFTERTIFKLFCDACQEIPEFTTEVSDVLHRRSPSVVQGTLITCDTPAYGGSIVKSEIREEYGELCVDMESFGTYYVCSLYKVPCISIRLVSDLCNQCAPLYIVRALSRLTEYIKVLVSYIFDRISFD